jgi:hypothetical protein
MDGSCFQPAQRAERDGTQTEERACKVSEKNGKKSSEKGDWQSQRIIVPMVRDAEHCSGLQYTASVPCRWGTDAQRTHCREGEAGYNVLLCGTTRGTLRP